MVVRPSIGGERLRIRLSNTYGASALYIGAVHVALTDTGSKIVPGTDRVVTFGGSSEIRIPAASPAISDSIDLPVKALSEVSISLYLPSSVDISTWHRGPQHDSYLAGPGNMTSSLELPKAEIKPAWFFLSALEMWEPMTTTTTVAFGDSITEGSNNLPAQYADYPDQLARRLVEANGGRATALINEGIGGNRILHDDAGASALSRFDQDVLSNPGIANLIVLEGINDIGFPRVRMAELKIPNANLRENIFASQKVSADEIVQGLQQIAVRAHDHGIRVFCGTLMPFEGTNSYDVEGEAIRVKVNSWIRASKVFEGVLDFDVLVRDPDRPTKLRLAFDSGDHIHPNPAGYKAMADLINLSELAAAKH